MYYVLFFSERIDRFDGDCALGRYPARQESTSHKYEQGPDGCPEGYDGAGEDGIVALGQLAR